jgi:SpoVK/Ycf46/Vps4 family AAA+-type ATPase
VKNVRIDYDNEIENSRINKRFIYSLKNVDSKEEQIKWLEKEITTTRNFENMFFPNRKEIMEKIDFFLKNKEWYTHEGHPYSLGIGLHGVPGTGKTSFIKALAKYTNRHLIVIPLNKIKTENDFYDAYFEEQYSTNNVKNIEFKDKIIVFEDIDCMSDIVKKRNVYENDEAKEVHTTYENSEASDIDDNNSTKNESKNDKNISEILINAACSMNNNTNTNRFKKKTEEFTLSFLLNTLDGLLETDGRILIITSNHYRKLDAALTRPGRIDIEIEMKPIEFDTINELYYHYYNENIPRKYQQKMRTIKIAPCDLINIQKTSNMTKTKFINSILQMRQ